MKKIGSVLLLSAETLRSGFSIFPLADKAITTEYLSPYCYTLEGKEVLHSELIFSMNIKINQSSTVSYQDGLSFAGMYFTETFS